MTQVIKNTQEQIFQNLKDKYASKKPFVSDAEFKRVKQITGYAGEYNEVYQFDIREYIDGAIKCKKCDNPANCSMKVKGFQPQLDKYLNLSYYQCLLYEWYLQQKRTEELLVNAKIPNAYKSMSLDNFNKSWIANGTQVVNHASSIVASKERGIIYTGNVGVGKTHLAMAILNKKLSRGITGVFATVPTLMQSLRNAIKDNSLDETLQKICVCDVLVLDDFGTENQTEWTNETMFTLLNDRYINSKQTIITTNYSIEQLEKRYGLNGERIVSRLLGICDVVEIKGKDRRYEQTR